VIAHLSQFAHSKPRILETLNLIFAHLAHASPACTIVWLMLLAAVLRRSDAQVGSTHPPPVVTHWLPVLMLPILPLALLFVLSVELVAEMDPVVTVVPYWPLVLIMFLTSALMDNVFEL
jgi:L-asparagine transporter-like permease